MALSDITARQFPITTIALESVGWVTKTIEVDHAAGWLPGQLFFGLIGGAGSADTKLPPAVLMEKDLVGETVHDSYDLNEALIVWQPQPADRAAMRLVDGTAVEEGDYVVPGPSGDVTKYLSGTHAITSILGMAMGDLDLTGDNEGDINLVEVLLF